MVDLLYHCRIRCILRKLNLAVQIQRLYNFEVYS